MEEFSTFSVFDLNPIQKTFTRPEIEEPVIPLIEKSFADKIRPVINKWLKFYELDINEFRGYVQEFKVDSPEIDNETDTASIYYWPYDAEYHNVHNPVLHDYSPNKQKYLNLRSTSGVFRDDDGKYYYYGGDDCQEIYLTDRKNKTNNLVLWLGALEFAEAAFWFDNDTYLIVGNNRYNDHFYFIQIGGKYGGRYEYKQEKAPDKHYFEYDLKRKGIIMD